MPVLYNGFGTRYGWKSNAERVHGVCEACGFTGMLDQYDTLLCLTALFVPLIPIRRVRVMDECPRCHRHRVAKLKEYELNRQLAVSSAIAEWQENPGVEKAVEAHQTMRAFRQQKLAETFMQELQSRYHADARLKAYHGSMLLEQGRIDDARLQLKEALRLRPDLAMARVPMSRILMEDGDADGAIGMLDFMMHPGAAHLHNLGPLESLALYLQANSRNHDALKIFRHLGEELPAVAQVPAFRAAVERSEKAVKSGATVLPPKRFSMHEQLFGARAKLVKGVLFVVMAGLVFTGRNFWIKGHRTVHVVNGWTEPVTLSLPDGRSIVAGPGRSSFQIGEGKHHIKTAGPVAEDLLLEMNAGFWERWTKHPAWVLNPGGAVLLMERHVTIHSGRQTEGQEPRLLAGQRVVAVPDVTHLFKPLPQSVSLKRGQQQTYHQLAEFDGPAAEAAAVLSGSDPAAALTAAQKGLRSDPGSIELMQLLSEIVSTPELKARQEAFLKPRIESRPVKVEWHRVWQGAKLSPARCRELAAYYDEELKQQPEDADLLYLRGRVSAPEEREGYTKRALAKAPRHLWAHFGMGVMHHFRGEDTQALTHLAEAMRARPHDENIEAMALLCRAASAPEAAMKEFGFYHATNTRNGALRAMLFMALKGERGKVSEALRGFSSLTDQGFRIYLHTVGLYAAGDFEKVLKETKGLEQSHALLRAESLMAMGRLKEASALMPPLSSADAGQCLSLALAAALSGDGSREELVEAARQKLSEGDMDEVHLAGLLGAAEAPSLDSVKLASVQPSVLAPAVALLALKYPERAGEYVPLARSLSAVLLPPMQLVRQAFSKVSPP